MIKTGTSELYGDKSYHEIAKYQLELQGSTDIGKYQL